MGQPRNNENIMEDILSSYLHMGQPMNSVNTAEDSSSLYVRMDQPMSNETEQKIYHHHHLQGI